MEKLLVMSFDSSCDFLITTCFWWLSVYYKVTKQMFVLQLVCKLILYLLKFFYCKFKLNL